MQGGTPPVKAAHDEFAAGRRGRVSEAAIRGEKTTVPYTMIITERRREEAQGAKEEDVREPPPHKRFIASATSRPDTDPDSYSARNGIEAGYRMVENSRVRTHSKKSAVRLLYFAFSVGVLNAWVVVNAVMAWMTKLYHAKQSPVTQRRLRDMVIKYYGGSRPPSEPPPTSPPPPPPPPQQPSAQYGRT